MNREEIKEEVDLSINSNNLELQPNPVQGENPPSMYSSNIVLFESAPQNSELPTSLDEQDDAIRTLTKALAHLNAELAKLTDDEIDLGFLKELLEIRRDLYPLQCKLDAIMFNTLVKRQINASMQASNENVENASKNTMN